MMTIPQLEIHLKQSRQRAESAPLFLFNQVFVSVTCFIYLFYDTNQEQHPTEQ